MGSAFHRDNSASSYRLSRLACRRAPPDFVAATFFRETGVFLDAALPLPVGFGRVVATWSTTSPGPVPPLSRAVASRCARNCAALVRAAAASAVLTLANAFSKASALSAARRFFGRAAPRPPT